MTKFNFSIDMLEDGKRVRLSVARRLSVAEHLAKFHRIDNPQGLIRIRHLEGRRSIPSELATSNRRERARIAAIAETMTATGAR